MSRKFPLACGLALLCALTAIPAQAAPAPVQRAFVSGKGDNANASLSPPCAVTTPCKTFAGALSAVAVNGEIVALDTAPYGSVTLTQSVSIIAAPGVYAGISVFAGAGITIATAGIKVVLRGININGQGGANAINLTAGARLSVENCVIGNMTGSGIVVNTAGAPVTVRVTDTIIRDNGGNGILLQDGALGTIKRTTISGNTSAGVQVLGTLAASVTTADITESTIDGNANGFDVSTQNATAVVKGAIHNSQIVRNSGNGVVAQSGVDFARVSVTSNIISNNNAGVTSSSGGIILLGGNTVTFNGTGLSIPTDGVIGSTGNNAVFLNTVDADAIIPSAGSTM